MKGIFVNIDDSDRAATLQADSIGTFTDTASVVTELGNRIFVNGHTENWPQGMIVSDPDRGWVAVGCGYFSYKGILGDLRGFSEAFFREDSPVCRMRACQNISSGSFLLYLEFQGRCYFITDPFGLSPHYIKADSKPLRVAPSPFFLGLSSEDPILSSILRKKRHLFGNYTAFTDVSRLDVGAIMAGSNVEGHYFDYLCGSGRVQDISQMMSSSMSMFDKRSTLLPLSGGLDSRFMLSINKMDYGYTYGPSDTGDRPIARRFRDHFREYEELSLLDLDYPKVVKDVGEQMMAGVVGRPLCELLVLYKRFFDRWGRGLVFVDGYLADTLQRGTYFTLDGPAGALYRLMPQLLFRNLSAEDLLRRRYQALDDFEIDFLLKEFREQTRRFDCDDWKKVFLFEVLYARGSRFIVHGGSVFASQFFTPVQPFFFYDVFRLFLSLDVQRMPTYEFLRPIWNDLSVDLKSTPTLDFYRPSWNASINRFVHVFAKLIERVRFSNRVFSYKDELPKIVWK